MNELSGTGLVLIGSAAATAALHTIVPDHWLPFVLVGKAQGWSKKKTLSYTAISALIHVLFSLALGVAGYSIGLASATILGERMELIVGLSLIGFGVLYIILALRAKGGVIHLGHIHGPHGHEHGLKGKKRNTTGIALALLMGLNPCVVALPIFSATIAEGLMVTALVSISFGVATIITLVGLTAIGVMTTYKLELKFLTKYGEIISGALLALAGIVFIFLH